MTKVKGGKHYNANLAIVF